ncbi:MAG: DCC1-like thiol-disulfide oxidoreductase family protein [Chlamydiales bacterium]|nr:DCC1-like thiol-disulfide oxidoreductase family protein [Chlamydiales bacterium]
MYDHLVFYDGECGLCDQIVQFLLHIDKDKKFAFAPLQGETAKELMPNPPDADSIVLIENFRKGGRETYIRSKAAFRILWLIGGVWSVVGVKNFLPAWMFDWAYNIVAANRHKWFQQTSCVVPDAGDKSRFLP